MNIYSHRQQRNRRGAQKPPVQKKSKLTTYAIGFMIYFAF